MPQLKIKPVLQTWGRALRGRVPSLSIEITKECPLRCPGCYAYEDAHLGTTNLRSLSDFKGQDLIERVLALVEEHRPLHLSIVGGDPLVRYRELDVLLPKLVKRCHVQVVTSAFRPIPAAWVMLADLQLVVSIDGLEAEHNARRKPATYERILRNIRGQRVVVHCTVTSAMLQRDDYLPAFVHFWSANPAVQKIWMSIFTPQRGAANDECVTADQRTGLVEQLLQLRQNYPKLDMTEGMIREFLSPPVSPDRCIFAHTTLSLSADLKTAIGPCQFGGDPDCSQCGCIASMGLGAVGHRKIVGPITAGQVFWASAAIGRHVRHVENASRRLLNRERQPRPDDSGGRLPADVLKVIH
jgi:sulfatase maturation enzyme AslB (radical SAM superfamily)